MTDLKTAHQYCSAPGQFFHAGYIHNGQVRQNLSNFRSLAVYFK